ncbi:DUF92 domain-containing protein [Fictibacillus sp. Mic-4]|uniref:DUF92 domain-containing protein n=1 Tax=Fictibacillus sp. Mic-4 TaxID=3132826 RepID=UPI003CF2A688
MIIIVTIVLGFFVYIAYRLSFLTAGGAIASWLVGLFVWVSFQIEGIVLLCLFFITSSLLSKFKKKKKMKLKTIEDESKGREAGQVFANGGVAFIASAGHLIVPHPFWIGLLVASLAEATADTWASEIGVLSRRKPFHLLRLRQVESGISGAVSIPGSIAALTGAFVMGVAGTEFLFDHWWPLSILFTTAGFFGNIVDTFLGGSVQVAYRCPICKIETETTIHCNHPTKQIKGYEWLTNNVVNFLSSLAAGVLGGVAVLWM